MTIVISGQVAVVRECKAARIFDDASCAVLLREYESECANPLLGACAPRREVYEALEAAGRAQCFAAYSGNALQGFAFVLRTELPHYEAGRTFAVVESLFVSRNPQATCLGGKLMSALRNHARQAGCESIAYSAPVNSRLALLLFLDSDRCINTHHIFCERL